MTLRQSTVAFGVLLAAFVISALYQLYRATLLEMPEYDAFTVATGFAYLIFAAGCVCVLNLLGARLVPEKD